MYTVLVILGIYVSFNERCDSAPLQALHTHQSSFLGTTILIKMISFQCASEALPAVAASSRIQGTSGWAARNSHPAIMRCRVVCACSMLWSLATTSRQAWHSFLALQSALMRCRYHTTETERHKWPWGPLVLAVPTCHDILFPSSYWGMQGASVASRHVHLRCGICSLCRQCPR